MQVSMSNLVASTALGLCLLVTPAISFAQSSGAGPANTGGSSSAECSAGTEGTTDANPGTVAKGLRQLRSAAAHLACAQRELGELATEMQQSNEAAGRALATVGHILSQLQPQEALGANTGSSSPPQPGAPQSASVAASSPKKPEAAQAKPPSSPTANSAQTSGTAGGSAQSREDTLADEAKAAGKAASAVVKSLDESKPQVQTGSSTPAGSAQPAEASQGQSSAAGSSEAVPAPQESGPSAAAPPVQPPAGPAPSSSQMLSLSSQPVPPKPDSAASEAGEVRASRLIAQKLYSEKGGTFAQVEDILIDPKSARVTGVLVDKLGPSGNYTGKQLVVPLADIKLTAGNWLVTNLGGAPLSQ